MRVNGFGTRAYTYRVTVPPTQLPVDLATIRNYLKINTPADDALLSLLISQATDFAEKFTRRDFITRTYETFRDFFPYWYGSEGYYTDGFLTTGSGNVVDVQGGNLGFEIRKSPLQSVSEISYLVNGVLTAVNSSVYYNTVEEDYSEILTLPNQVWPQNADRRLQSVVITFITGFGGSHSEIPPWVKEGILNHVAFMYENRGDCVTTSVSGSSACDCSNFLPVTSKSIYLQNRIHNL